MPVLFYGAVLCWLVAAITWALAYYGRLRKASYLGGGLEITGFFLWTVALVSYALSSGPAPKGHSFRWPLATPAEFLLAMVWGTVLIHTIVELTEGGMGEGYPALILALIMALFGGKTFAAKPLPLQAAFRSIWFQLHTLTAALAYGAFTVGCGIAALRILSSELPSERGGLTKALKIGYLLLTLSMITGAIWGQLTWGNYWSWSLKEIWTFIVWMLYTLFFHIQPLPRWKGRPAFTLVAVAFAVVLFTLLGTEWLARKTTLEIMHVY
ncbi:MAG: hypothetical protein DRI61_15295 [Chloroflexi bacterium]|nr:MAG: hypothetical protein DRI61_15295 [Chloroflexota bacterium]HDN79626.1 hypothetical protein [Chloroflexota bacterium]